jgi:putative methyltransferase (TIGR04325 family)
MPTLKIKDLLPPFLYDQLRQSSLRRYGWFGDYPNWEAAQAASVGYDSNLIIQKVLDSTLKVKNGEYPYERDSVLFDHIVYDWPLLAGLMWVAARNKGELNVLDYGGSLGSTYWQNRKFIQTLPRLTWNIIEQLQYVEMGRKHFQDDTLKFYNDLESCLQVTRPNLILISSVINYIKDPYSLLRLLCELKIPHMIIERIPFIERGTDRLTVQKVPPKIYTASYPAWFFDKTKFLSFIGESYDVREIFESSLQLTIKSEVKGLILTLKGI